MNRRVQLARLAGASGLAFLFVLSDVHAQPASLDTPPQEATLAQTAASAFWEGKRLYDAGQFDQARERFEFAFGLIKDPTLLYNIGQSYRQLGQCRSAEGAYQKFLALVPDSPLAAQTEEHLKELARSCPLEVTTPAVLSATALQPAPAAVVAESSPTSVARSPRAVVRSDKPVADETRLYLTWATLAAGLVAGGTATGISIWNRHRYEEWKTEDASLVKGNAKGESGFDWSIRQQDNDERIQSIARVDRIVRYVGVASGALLAGSVILFFTTPRPMPTASTARTTAQRTWCVPAVLGPREASVTMVTSF